MSNYRVISSDNHVVEPADLWTSRPGSMIEDRVPRIVREEDSDWWYCDNHRVIGTSVASQTGLRFEEPEKLTMTSRYEAVRPGGYISEEHIEDMHIDGIDVSIVYPTVGLLLYSVEDGELLSSQDRSSGCR